MNLLKFNVNVNLNLNRPSRLFHCSHTPYCLSPSFSFLIAAFRPPREPRRLLLSSHSLPVSNLQPKLKSPRVSNVEETTFRNEEEVPDTSQEAEDLSLNGAVYQKTLRLVECSMFAALSGLAYFLSNSLAIENYLGCFFSLPIVISSLRWGVAAGRKTMVATAMLLLVLSGPIKALTYLLMHGLLGFTMGSLWRLGAQWGPSICLCMLVRAVCALAYVLISSFLIRDNILSLITINLHASISFIFSAWGINTIPSMEMIYAVFGTVLLLNVASYVFLLHILYSVFLTRLGMKASLNLPRWLEKAI